jgi:hypothetical protein
MTMSADVVGRAARGLLLVAGCAVLEVLAWRLTSVAVPTARAALDSDAPLGARGVGALMTALAAVLLLLAWSWLTCATVLVVGDLLGHQPRPRMPRRGIPAGWQRTVAGLLGAGALCIPGAAVADGPGEAPDRAQPGAASINGLPLPDRPNIAGATAPLTHRVVAGQSLWAIAREHLAPDATSGRIAAEWPRWYAANAAVIGDDPDLITPGTLLRSPAEHAPRPQEDHLAAGTDPARTDGGPR